MKAAREFWDWFSANEYRFRRPDDRRDAVLAEIGRSLARFDARLGFELSGSDRGARSEFILTAGGDPSLFGVVKQLVAMAPDLEHWLVCALMPPRGFRFVMEADGDRISPSDLHFEPMLRSDEPDALGLMIFVPPSLAARADILSLLRRIIEIGLGEEIAATQVQHIEASMAPHEVEKFIRLDKLQEFLSWRRTQPAQP